MTKSGINLYLCNMSDKNKILKFLIQVIGWGLVFGFPLFFTWKEGNPMTWVKFLGYVGVPIAFITVFYANYFIFIDRLLFRKRLLVFIIVNLFLFVLLSLCLHGWQEYYFIHFVNEGPRHSRPPDFVNVSPKNHLQIMGRYVDVVS